MSGPLDRDAVTRLCAGLMALDGQSGDDVELVVNSEGGPLAEASAVLDVIELMRAPVNTTCVGAARGTAGIVVACGTGRRRAARHATISLRCDHPESIQGSAADIDRAVRALDAMRHRMHEALVAATGQPPETIAAEIEHGAIHDAPAALALHLIDEITDGR
jgi:ATP-dependent Clp protease protease subunit